MEPEQSGRFVRGLGFWGAYALVVGSMIGTGIFFFVSPVAQKLGSAPAILATWSLGALIASCGALSVAELAATYPEAGGPYVYLRRAYGRLVAFLYVWVEFLIVRIGNIAIFGLAFAGFLRDALGATSPSSAGSDKLIALGAIAAIAIVNAFGVGAGGRAQIVLSAAKLVALVTIVAVGCAYAAGWLGAHPVDLGAGVSAPPSTALVAFAAALIPVMWSLGGWDEATFVAEEVVEPHRNVPRAVVAGIYSVGVLYVAVNAAYILLLSTEGLAASERRTAALALATALGAVSGRTLSVVLTLTVLGTLNAVMLSGARLAYAATKELPALSFLARLDPRTGAPIRTLCLEAGAAALLVLAFASIYDILLYTAVAYWTFAGMTAFAVVVLRRRDPERPRPFRTPAFPLPPIVFASATAMMVVAASLETRSALPATAGILLAGSLAYGAQRFAAR